MEIRVTKRMNTIDGKRYRRYRYYKNDCYYNHKELAEIKDKVFLFSANMNLIDKEFVMKRWAKCVE